MCVLFNDQILIADCYNHQVKLLNPQYQVLGHCDFNHYPNGICQITPNEVAIAVDEIQGHGVQFVTVDDWQLFNPFHDSHLANISLSSYHKT
ncbi:hypothetical protein DPMN_157188 [Dreissena polymorpha]|uniref:Uncharacterized protein n=1 Tax=Dreissena polymorpha TaxID=45954 RepID=A0A9D4EGM9_DREPO|nr:hypothetical protein DPMN_157188 [Dreissena polymorpha]